MANQEIKALSKIGKALETLPVAERRDALAFLEAPGDMVARAVAVHRVASVLEPFDSAARRRALDFFADQIGGEPDPAPRPADA